MIIADHQLWWCQCNELQSLWTSVSHRRSKCSKEHAIYCQQNGKVQRPVPVVCRSWPLAIQNALEVGYVFEGYNQLEVTNPHSLLSQERLRGFSELSENKAKRCQWLFETLHKTAFLNVWSENNVVFKHSWRSWDCWMIWAFIQFCRLWYLKLSSFTIMMIMPSCFL